MEPRPRASWTGLHSGFRLLDPAFENADFAGGRDGDFDLYDHPGGYRRVMYSKAVGQPCPVCGTPITKEAYLGGAVYTCPTCQPDPRSA